jgi:curved DNA-binding protein
LSNVVNLYQTLGVQKSASQTEIKKAYRKLAGEFHPDKKPGAANEARFKEVTNAYEVLSDKEKRALYDEFGEVSLRSGFDANAARAAKNFRGFGGGQGGAVNFDLNDLFGGGQRAQAGGAGFGDMFGDLFRRNRAAGGPPQRRGQDTVSTVKISFVDAVSGTTLRLSPSGGGEAISVRIPAGADNGSRVRVRGKGGSGMGNGPPGDLILTIEVEPHAHFTRDGDNLSVDVPVTLSEAFGGAQIMVPTPKGEVKLTVPAGVQSGQKVRLRGKGVARAKKSGDLYVRFMVVYPAVDDEAVAEAVKVIAQHETNPRDKLTF